MGWHDWDLDGFVEDLAEDRVVEVENMIWNDGEDDDGTVTPIQNNRLPLKFGPSQLHAELQRMFPDRQDLFASCVSIKFPSHDLSFYWAEACFDDPEWRDDVSDDGTIPVELGDDGDAQELYSQYENRVYTIGPDGTVN